MPAGASQAAFGCTLGIVPQMAAAGGELSGVFMAVTFAVFAVYGLFAASLRDRVISRPAVMAWLRGSFAVAFAALGAKLALAER